MKDDTREDVAIGLVGTLLGFIGAFAGQSAVHAGAQKVGEIIDRKIGERFYSHEEARGMLGWDLSKMPLNDQESFVNWVARSQKKNREDDIVRLLSKIPRNPETGWQAQIKYLNGLTDKQRNQFLEILHHDAIPQWIGKHWKEIKKNGGVVSKKQRTELRDMLSKVRDCGSRGLEALDDAAGELAPKVGGLAGWLHKLADDMADKGGRR